MSPAIIAQAPTEPDEYALGEDDIVCDAAGAPLASWFSQGTVINKVDIAYDWNLPPNPGAFSRRKVWTADQSVERYTAQQALVEEWRGVRSTLGGDDVVRNFAIIFEQRWGYPPPILDVSITFRRHLFQALDTVRLTHSKIPNYLAGKMGLVSERFEIINVSARLLTQGRLVLSLLQVGAIETSAVPTSPEALVLTPVQTTIDPTDSNVPLASTLTVTTPVACNQIRLGFKAQNYRTWECRYDDFAYQAGGKDQPPTCVIFAGNFADHIVYTSRITYHIDYKKNGVPDQMGTGNDPSTGWVPLLASTQRGSVSQFAFGGCVGSEPSVPSEDVWNHYFPDLVGDPATYNVRIYFDSIDVQADPCPLSHVNCAVGVGCSSTFTGSALLVDQKRLTLDYIEAIVE